MGNSYTKRKQRLARMEVFKNMLADIPQNYEVTQHTKYHYSFQRLQSDGFLTDPVQAYPTTLRLVTYDGTIHNCITIADMFIQIETELHRET